MEGATLEGLLELIHELQTRLNVANWEIAELQRREIALANAGVSMEAEVETLRTHLQEAKDALFEISCASVYTESDGYKWIQAANKNRAQEILDLIERKNK